MKYICMNPASKSLDSVCLSEMFEMLATDRHKSGSLLVQSRDLRALISPSKSKRGSSDS